METSHRLIQAEENAIDDNNSNYTASIMDCIDIELIDCDVEFINSDDDMGMDSDNFEGMTFQMTSRTATENPADNSGLSTELIYAAQAQEEAEDRCVREMAAPNTCLDFDWTHDQETFTGKRESFTGTPGPTFPVTNDLTPMDIFFKMFDDDFFNLIVTETNRYADQIMTALKQNPNVPKNARCLHWTPTDRNEMVGFLAVIILQGLYPKVNEQAYFNFDGFGTTPYFGNIMSFNRYYLLKAFMHFIDNKTSEDTTKLNKIRPIIDYFNSHFASLYSPGQEIALDESLLKWHGRLSFAQKISSKAARVGVKTYELCESSTGYLWAFRVYTGKDGPNRTQLTEHRQDGLGRGEDGLGQEQDGLGAAQDGFGPEQDGLGQNGFGSGEFRLQNATSKIVYDLVEPLLEMGHTLIMDNFYNSPLLARCLKKQKTDVFGTLRMTRANVPDALKTMSKTDMRQGEVAVSYCSDLAVMLWRDAKLVGMISTYHPLQFGTSKKYNKVVYRPSIVLDYNKSMGGVDRKDQFLASQPLERQKNKVWYKKLFRRLYNAALFNCFTIFTSNPTHKKISHRDFRRMLAETLLKVHRHIDIMTEPRMTRDRKTNRLTVHQTKRPLVEENHFPMKTGSTATRCWMCTRNKRSTRTAYKCEECNINLCIIGCFKDYHKRPQSDQKPHKDDID